MKEKFKGLWPAMFTPVDDDEEPAYNEIEKLVELFISQQMDGLYILGSTGQGLLFTENQRKKVTEVVSKTSAGRIPIIVHVGSLTTSESIRLAQHAEKCGVDGVSSVPPIYYTGNADTTLEHYNKIAGSTSLPFFPYQLGDNSIPDDVHSFIDRLLKIPNITGMKLTTNQLLNISGIHNYAEGQLRLFSGSDELFCHATLCGTVGAIGTFYNIWGAECKYVMSEFVNGNYKLGKKFMLSFQKIIQFVLPNAWPFFRKAMLLKYNIDIGPTKAPLGNTQKEWKNNEVQEIIEKIESVAGLNIHI
ncbi:MAG TPA: dihydrodipicolinate synthase family protein [Hanamia sp.]|nr:dihydrodipicolinate synthase family protein [Hanamia sp.]